MSDPIEILMSEHRIIEKALTGLERAATADVPFGFYERTVQFLDGKVLDRALAWRNMAAIIGHWEIRGYGFFSVESRETGEWLGRVGPWYRHL